MPFWALDKTSNTPSIYGGIAFFSSGSRHCRPLALSVLRRVPSSLALSVLHPPCADALGLVTMITTDYIAKPFELF